MTDKEKFLAISTYEEFNKRRGEFKELSMSDMEIRRHASEIFGRSPNPPEELYKKGHKRKLLE